MPNGTDGSTLQRHSDQSSYIYHDLIVALVKMAPYYDSATRAQVLAYKILGLTNADIEARTGINPRTVNNILDRAVKRGFDPDSPTPIIFDYYVKDAPKSGRPKKQASYKDEVLTKVQSDRYGREKTYA